jgi:hypothetical protein
MAGKGLPGRKWTLDAWNNAFDWNKGHPEEAADFLKSQGLAGDFGNLTAKALRCIGFTALYEAGRIGPVTGEEAVPSKNDLSRSLKVVKSSVSDKGLENETAKRPCSPATLQRRKTVQIFVKNLKGRSISVVVHDCTAISPIKRIIYLKEGVHPVLILLHILSANLVGEFSKDVRCARAYYMHNGCPSEYRVFISGQRSIYDIQIHVLL